MKKFLLSIATLTLAATASFAQSSPAPQKPAAPATPPAAADAPKVAKAPQAKTPEEYKAYQAAVAITEPAASEAAADEFAKKYPESELRVTLYSLILQKAYEANDSERIIALGKKVLAIEPTNPMTLVVTATALAETTKETDLDYAEKSAEATKLGDDALKSIDTMLPQPNVAPEQFEGLKNTLRSMVYSTKGYMAMNKKDYATGESAFQKAIDANPQQQDPILYLRLAVCQEKVKRFAPALANANKAIQAAEAQNNTQVANLARSERDVVQRMMNASTPAKTPATTTPPKQ
jgi:tetratricopeptide (TPR) repeat protein